MAAAAKELGYDISIAALEQAKAEALNPAELEQAKASETKWTATIMTHGV